jgi:uncharacterized repeat protein (TIGR01451 family)
MTGTFTNTYTATCTYTSTETRTPTPTYTSTPMPSPVLLKTTKTASGENPAIGAKIDYELIIENNDTAPAANIRVWDTLPAGVAYSTYSGTQPTVIGNYMYWELPAVVLNPGERLYIEFEVVMTDYKDGVLVMNRAAADYNDPYYQGTERHPPVGSNLSFYPLGVPVIFPNPFNKSTATGGKLKFMNIVPGSIISIFTISGEAVTSTNVGDDTRYSWNGTNYNGSPVSPGIYYYTITNATTRQFYRGKIFVVNG